MSKQTFNKASKTYDDYAQPQQWAATYLRSKFPEGFSPQRIVEFGCGTGLLTQLLQQQYPNSDIIAVDAAEAMIEAARLRPGLGDVEWVVDDLEAVEIPSDTDLLVSGCTFHWLENLPDFFSKLRKSVQDETPLIFSIMLKGTVIEVRDVRRQALPHHPQPKEMPSLKEIQTACEEAGWQVEDQEELPYCTRFTSALDLLQSLQRTGVTGGRYGTKGQPLYRGELRHLMNELTRIYGQHQDGIPLHYQVGFLTCRAR
jgi:malonyl-CoA O-methyltransferase